MATEEVRENSGYHSNAPTRANAGALLNEGRSAASARSAEAVPPGMATLADFDQAAIDRIVQTVPGGVNNIQEIYPLAPLQEGVLFHHILNPDAGTYVLSTLLELHSKSQLRAFIAAVQAVIDRHDVLRTAVLWEKLPRPVQVVYRRALLSVEEVPMDLDGDPIEELVSRMRHGFDIRNAPLMRMHTASSQAGDRYYVLLQRHHIVFDHQSWSLVFAEILAYLKGRQADLPRPRAYREYVEWSLRHAATDDGEAFFRKKFGDWEKPTAPFGLLNVREDGAEIDEAHEALDLALARRVRALGERTRTSAARLIHAAWALVVARTTGQDDVVFGTVLSASRNKIEQARARPGLFVNTLPLRVKLRNLTAEELVQQVDLELKSLSLYQPVSLTRIQQCARTGTAPLFTAVLNYRHSAGHSVLDPNPDDASSTGLAVLAHRYRTNYPITLVVDDLGEGFTLTAQTDQRVNAANILRYMQSSISALAEALEKESHEDAYALSILPPDELRRIDQVSNGAEIKCLKYRLIHELFEEQVGRTPDASAVLHEDASLTYEELNVRADRLARFLRSNGVGPDRLVGVCVERSIEMIIGLLAILKAGGAYVPLDPNHPVERLEYMLEDSAPQLVLTEINSMRQLQGTGAPVLELNAGLNWRPASSSNFEISDLGLTGANLLYLIYTSGSTGRPKGTAMSHRSMFNLIEWHRRNLPLREGGRVLQFAALSFDVAFQEIFSTLCTGGTLVLVEESKRKDPDALMSVLENHSVERLFVPPMMLQALAESFRLTGMVPRALKDIIAAGEQLRITPEIVTFLKQIRECRLHNHYGPTETHVVTSLTLDGDPSEWPSLPSIGRPIANTQIYVLDQWRQIAPIGVVGEIYIGGENVALGYLNRPGLTAERFICNPFSTGPNARLYKTGDAGRWGADGTLEYLGRDDGQVKIRGFRIELGEVEAQLSSYEHVKHAVVVMREDASGDKQLVAYVVARNEQLDVDQLRGHAKTLLPAYMLPSAFVVLEQFPMTPTGKLDRRSLPEPQADAYRFDTYEAPLGEVEELIAGIWEKLLRVEHIGRNDNFFDLGGHSLLATRVVSHISQALDVSVPVRVIFEYPTVQLLAEAVLQEVIDRVAMEAL